MSTSQIIVLLLRWICAIGIELLAFRLLGTAVHGSGEINVLWDAMRGFACLIAGVFLIGPELIAFIATPVHEFINGLIFPAHSEPPPVDYTLARFYRRKLRFDESIEAYLKIIRYHPQELPAYSEAIETAFESGMPAMAQKIQRMGTRKLRSENERNKLKQTFEYAANQVVYTREEG